MELERVVRKAWQSVSMLVISIRRSEYVRTRTVFRLGAYHEITGFLFVRLTLLYEHLWCTNHNKKRQLSQFSLQSYTGTIEGCASGLPQMGFHHNFL